MIKRLFAASALLALFATAAEATMNIRQNGDGTADWMGRTGNSGNCVGGHVVSGDVLLGSGSNVYTLSPITNAVIKRFWGVQQGATTNTALVTVFASQTASAVSFVNPSGTTKSTAVSLAFHAGSAGQTRGISSLTQAGATGLAANTLEENGYIRISSNGAGSGTVTARILVQVCPR